MSPVHIPLLYWIQKITNTNSHPGKTKKTSCWDGKSLDSPNHQSHMYNTVNSEYFNNAPACPSSHPVRVPQVTFEITWDTQRFASLWDPAKDGNPFVWSFEGNGAGTHADYMFGWKGDSLQKAMDKSECFYDGCGSIKKQAMSEANKCTVKDFVRDNIDGCMFSFFFLFFKKNSSDNPFFCSRGSFSHPALRPPTAIVLTWFLYQQGKNSCPAWISLVPW